MKEDKDIDCFLIDVQISSRFKSKNSSRQIISPGKGVVKAVPCLHKGNDCVLLLW
jgi:hypothetical protein